MTEIGGGTVAITDNKRVGLVHLFVAGAGSSLPPLVRVFDSLAFEHELPPANAHVPADQASPSRAIWQTVFHSSACLPQSPNWTSVAVV